MSDTRTSLMGRIALVTGANSGLGKATATALAERGATVIMVARDPVRGAAAQAEIRDQTGNPSLHLLVADLSSQQEIRGLVEAFEARFDRLDWLINNAGTAFPERRLSPDGIEMSLAVNHLAPFLLTNLLRDRLVAGAPSRVITVGTRIDTSMDLADLNWQRRRYRMMAAYGQSKLGNIHFTHELARRLEGTGVSAFCVFPGVFMSNLGKTDGAQGAFWRIVGLLAGWAMPSAAQAAERVLHLILAPEAEAAGLHGRYVAARGRPIEPPSQARDPKINRRVWALSEELTDADRRVRGVDGSASNG
ncbi:SDR family oxidoreductase [Thioalkalicoccus limnaeus]|uniref:SDR family oxidoreductase n=1 Tax=Thioalkalicoccus limnaeus TaxID=120681 RepID=A0ABV4BDM6_9GAMM